MRSLSFGEILWDIIDGKAYIGGAPFNLAAHLAKLGVSSYIVSAVGGDELGRAALERADELGVATAFLTRIPTLPTGTVDVLLSPEGQPTYTIHENTAWDAIALDGDDLAAVAASEWDAFCFGTLAQRSERNRSTLSELVHASRAKNVVYDVNLRQRYYEKSWIEQSLEWATILKLNAEEAEVIAAMLFGKVLDTDEFCDRVGRSFEIPIVCVTQGAEGAAVWSRGSTAWVPGVSVEVQDTVGAGDSFTAAFLAALDGGKSVAEAAKLACRVGAWVASCRSAVPDYGDEIRELFSRP